MIAEDKRYSIGYRQLPRILFPLLILNFHWCIFKSKTFFENRQNVYIYRVFIYGINNADKGE